MGLSQDSLTTTQVSERGGTMMVEWDRKKGVCRLTGEAIISREGTLFY